MKKTWEIFGKHAQINYRENLYNVESKTYFPSGLFPGIFPHHLHYGMFNGGVQKLGTDAQWAQWGHDIRSLRVMGCYAQTELGHGSNVAGLETTATLDLKTDEFIIHSPTVTSTKYWPGGLGRWANHALVFARCIVEDNDYGVASFIVPIRDQ